MTPLVQVCIVVAVLSLVAIAVATVRALMRFEKTADQLSRMADVVQGAVVEINQVTREVHEFVGTMSAIAPRVRSMAGRLEALGERTARLSEALFDEVEPPVRTAVAALRGVKAGAWLFADRLVHRLTERGSHNGGNAHE